MFDERLNPEACAAADDGEFAAACNVSECRARIAEEMRNIVVVVRIRDIEKVMGDFFGVSSE